MALARTLVSTTQSAAGVASIVSPAFTPPNNSLILVTGKATNNGGSTNPAASFSLANSASLTATLRATAGVARDYGNGITKWTIPVVTGVSMTVTLTGVSPWQYGELQIITYTGHDVASPVGAILQTTGGTADGAWNPTLNASPASTSEVVASICAVMNSGAGSVAEGSGWTELFERSQTDWYVFQSQVRGGSTSNVVAWADTQANANSYYYGPTGVAVEIKAAGAGAYSLTCAQGSYTLTGQTATPFRAFTLSAAQGSYALTGQATNFLRGPGLQAEQGSYALTGQTANLLGALILLAAQGSYALTGQVTNLRNGFTLQAAQDSYALNGQTATLTKAGSFIALAGSYSVTGSAALVDLSLFAEQGSYALTGQDVTLTKVGGAVSLTAEFGAYALTGFAAMVDLSLFATQGSYALTGQALDFARGIRMAAGQGGYTLTGNATVLTWSEDPTPPGDEPGEYCIVIDRRRH